MNARARGAHRFVGIRRAAGAGTCAMTLPGRGIDRLDGFAAGRLAPLAADEHLRRAWRERIDTAGSGSGVFMEARRWVCGLIEIGISAASRWRARKADALPDAPDRSGKARRRPRAVGGKKPGTTPAGCRAVRGLRRSGRLTRAEVFLGDRRRARALRYRAAHVMPCRARSAIPGPACTAAPRRAHRAG